MDSYKYSGCRGKSPADTASKETSVFLYEVKAFLSLSMFPGLLQTSSSCKSTWLESTGGYRTFVLMCVLKKISAEPEGTLVELIPKQARVSDPHV